MFPQVCVPSDKLSLMALGKLLITTPVKVTTTANPFIKVKVSTFKTLPRSKVKKEQVAQRIEEEPRVVNFREAFTKYNPRK